jgi:uncharacterized membrane protein YjfL (UPF0719 family)
MPDFINLTVLVNSLLYSMLGIAVFWIWFLILDKVTLHDDLWKEIVERKNQSLATVVAAMCISIAIIVASAIH